MTLKDAMAARWFNINDIVRESGLTKQTIYGILGKPYASRKSGPSAYTLLKISEALNARIVIDASKKNKIDFILKEVK